MNDTVPAYLERLRLPASPGEVPPPPPPEGYRPATPELVEIPRAFPPEFLDPDAVRIVRRLSENGFIGYLVGGCVRDLMFGLKPKDFDVVTSATPRDMRKLFRNCRIIGRRFRLAHVFFRDKIIEVATFRAASTAIGEADAEVEASRLERRAEEDALAAGTPVEDIAGDDVAAAIDGNGAHGGNGETAPEGDAAEGGAPAKRGSGLLIRDDNVFGTPAEDAVRRDFTVNALFYDVERGVILDHVHGVDDVERHEIRTIGDPHVRLREDPIRMLRAIRLAARMGCRIEPGTWDAIQLYRHEILHAAAPRISEDILRMFRGGAIAPAFDMMVASGVLEVILPELYAHLAEALRERGPEEVEALRNALRVADAMTQSGRALTTPVQLTLLLAPALLAGGDGKGGRGLDVEAASEMLKPIALRLAISRRDGERIRQILTTLPKLVPPPPGRKRRAAAPLLRRAFLPETVDVFEVMALATGELVEEAARWRRKIAEAFPQGVPVPEKKPRRDRRSGGHGHRRRPQP